MRVSRLAFLLGLIAAAAFAGIVSAEDLTITYKVTGRGDAPTTTTQYYSASKIRVSDGERDTILDFAAGRILTIDSKKKEYSEMLLSEIEAAMKQASAQMEETMKNVPPAMRERMEKMMGGGAGGAVANISVTKGGTRKVAGYACQEYTIAMGENFKNDTCNTTALAIPFDPAQYRKMWSFSNPAFMKNAAKMAEQMQKVEGLPLAENTSVNMMGRSMTTTKEATEVKKGAIAASVFEPPAGFKKVESPLKQMPQGRPGRRN
jgi:hypothetical protein